MDSFLSWFQKVEKVQFLSIEERALTFKAKKAFKIGSRPTISISIPIPTGGAEDFKLPVTITRVRQVGKGAVVCTGLVPGAAHNVEQLRQILSGVDPTAPMLTEGDDGEENMRRARRFHWSIRVLSKDLPGFRAISLDFNRLGVKLSTEGPAELGKVISLMLEIETAKTHEVLCQGLVRWNKEINRRKFEVGVEFTELDPLVAKELEHFERFLEGRIGDDVAKRQVMDSSFYETEAFGPGVDDLLPSKKVEEPEATATTEAPQ
jgi:hypothetical protein